MNASMIEFYTKHAISPVRQDISNLREHYQKREALYRQLGILPPFLKDRTVLEIGPGSGFNSLYTASLSPSRYVLVERNPTGVNHVRELFSHYPNLEKNITIEETDLRTYSPFERFDFVFCEGVLSGVPDPEDVLKHIAQFVDDCGSLIITCIDDISYFADTLRRHFAQQVIDSSQSLETQVDILMPIFSPHLSRLQGMNRRHDDWIIDNLINPASMRRMISIPEAISAIAEHFDFYASSPHFVTDWRWYKSVRGTNRNFNELAINQYWQNVHNFFDSSQIFSPHSKEKNSKIYNLCSEAKKALKQFEETRELEYVKTIQVIVEEVTAQVVSFSKDLANIFREVSSLLSQFPVDRELLAKSVGFGSLFGRGQQYVHFNRKLSLT